jgi:hypothetical protein
VAGRSSFAQAIGAARILPADRQQITAIQAAQALHAVPHGFSASFHDDVPLSNDMVQEMQKERP